MFINKVLENNSKFVENIWKSDNVIPLYRDIEWIWDEVGFFTMLINLIKINKFLIKKLIMHILLLIQSLFTKYEIYNIFEILMN